MTGRERPGPQDWTLRDAADDDAEGLIRCDRGGCFAEYPGCVLDLDDEMPDLLRMHSAWRQKQGRAWVVEDGQGLLGCVAAEPAEQGDGMELKRLYVAARARRRGVASRLCREVEQEARRRGSSFVELWTDTRFVAAHRLYEHLGYVTDGRSRELHDLSNSVEYFYRLALGGSGQG